MNFGNQVRGMFGMPGMQMQQPGMSGPAQMGMGMAAPNMAMPQTNTPSMWGGGAGGGGLGNWMRDPNNQMIMAQIMSAIGNVYTGRENRKMQRDVLAEERRQYDVDDQFRRRGDKWVEEERRRLGGI